MLLLCCRMSKISRHELSMKVNSSLGSCAVGKGRCGGLSY
jgi:hypothetical protein